MSDVSVAVSVTDSAVHDVPARTTLAWAAHDPEAFAAVFTQDANVVIAGSYLVGRDAVRSYLSAAFAGPMKGTRVVSDPVYLEYLSPDMALMVTVGGALVPGEAEVSPQRALRGTWVLVNGGHEWLIRAYHSSPIPVPRT
jgi:uncharacterized protein (TIGR02246 family)